MTETAIQKFDPKAPVGTAMNLKALLERSSDSFKELLPKHVTPERLSKLLLVAANKNPDILHCTQASVVETVMRAAELGLDFGQLGGAHAVPFGSTLQLIPDYRGLVKLIRQTGDLLHVNADVVHKNDHFLIEKGARPNLEFRPCLDGSRGEKIGAYAVIVTKDGGVYPDFMTVTEIEKVRKVSKAGQSQSGPWVQWWDEQAKKTVLRRCTKLCPMSSEKLERALEIDNEGFDMDGPITIQHRAVPASGGIGAALDALVDDGMLDSGVGEPPEPPTRAPAPAPAKRSPKKASPPSPKAEIVPPTPAESVAPEPEEPEIPWNDPNPEPEAEEEDEFVPDVGALVRAAETKLGKFGPKLVKAFAKAELGLENLNDATEDQYLTLDSYIRDTAEANRGE